MTQFKAIAKEILEQLEHGTWAEQALVETIAHKFSKSQEKFILTVLRKGEVLGLWEKETTPDNVPTGRWQLGPLLVGTEPPECRRKGCSYYHHYLAYGPAELTHEGFHAAEVICERWQRRALDWLEQHKDDRQPFPEHLDKICRAIEARVRA